MDPPDAWEREAATGGRRQDAPGGFSGLRSGRTGAKMLVEFPTCVLWLSQPRRRGIKLRQASILMHRNSYLRRQTGGVIAVRSTSVRIGVRPEYFFKR